MFKSAVVLSTFFWCGVIGVAMANPVIVIDGGEKNPEQQFLNLFDTKRNLILSQPLNLSASEIQLTTQASEIEFDATDTPLQLQQLQQTTAATLGQGEVVIDFNNRFFFTDSVEEEGTSAYLNFGFAWGVTDELEVSLTSQRVDTAFPGRQGELNAIRNPIGENNFLSEQELTLQLKQQLWQSSESDIIASGVVALSIGDRGFLFTRRDGSIVDEGSRSGIVPALQAPLTFTQDQWQFTISPTVAFFDEENALHIHRLPGDDREFGTTFGVTAGVAFNVNPRLTFWGDAFLPFTGNNSIDRDSGSPEQTLAFNGGIRYLVNPRLAVDVFASNTQGSKIPLSLTADKDNVALGLAVKFMPDFIGGNRRYPSSFDTLAPDDTPLTVDGIAFYDGGIVRPQQFVLNLQGGSQGVLTSLRYGMVRDFEFGIYLDSISGDVDESEQGFSGKIRLLNQAKADPITASIAATIGLTNDVFINFTENDADAFDDSNLDDNIPFFFEGDNEDGRRFLFTVSLPLQYQFNSGAAVWATPVWGFVQRQGTEIAGLNLGGSIPVASDWSVIGEIGANFADEGNALIDGSRENEIPWTVGVRWLPSELFGSSFEDDDSPALELYLTNRVGSSPFQYMRVREDNDLAVGVGVSIPFSF